MKRIKRLKKPLFGGLILCLSVFMREGYANEVDLSQSPEVSVTGKERISVPKEQDRIALNYVNQPPLIPHTVDGYQISKNFNHCLQCHGIEYYRAAGAPRISPTHFADADGKVLGEVAPRRYFCLQCHVTQANASPIIANNFQAAPGFGN